MLPSSWETQLSVGVGRRAQHAVVAWKSGDVRFGWFFSPPLLWHLLCLIHRADSPISSSTEEELNFSIRCRHPFTPLLLFALPLLNPSSLSFYPSLPLFRLHLILNIWRQHEVVWNGNKCWSEKSIDRTGAETDKKFSQEWETLSSKKDVSSKSLLHSGLRELCGRGGRKNRGAGGRYQGDKVS